MTWSGGGSGAVAELEWKWTWRGGGTGAVEEMGKELYWWRNWNGSGSAGSRGTFRRYAENHSKSNPFDGLPPNQPLVR